MNHHNKVHFPSVPIVNPNNSINIDNSNILKTHNSFYNNANLQKNFTRNNFNENLFYTPRHVENDDEVKRNITEQIKSVRLN